MRTLPLLLTCALLSACASARDRRAEPGLEVRYSDLDLETRDGRAELRRRVRVEIETFCRFHRRDVVPQVLTRLDTHYCRVAAREEIAREMPESVRRAYRSALEEAGPGTL
jgi:UrcA family protein